MKNCYWITLASVLAACGADFEPGTRIESPRILALQADRPFARPGEDVALTLLSANPTEQPLEWAWASCTLPPSSTVDDCLATLDHELEPFDPKDVPLTVHVPSDALQGIAEDERPSALIGVVIVACPGRLERGTTEGVPTRCVDEGGHPLPVTALEVGIKRIFLREHDRNDNPGIEAITWDGAPWPEDEVRRAKRCEEDTFEIDDCSSSLRHRIAVRTTPKQAGRDEFGGAFEEQQIVQFYATHGLFRDPVRIAEDTDNLWVAQAAAYGDATRATLWLITRDDRGGVSWAVRRVQLE